MIHRQNFLDVRHYLRHLDRVRQLDPMTVKKTRTCLRHLLEWADEMPLPKARAFDPTFPAYLLTARNDGRQKSLSPATITKCLMAARQFLAFARLEWPLRYKPITESWIQTLQPPRHVRLDSRLPVRQVWTLEEVRQVAAVSTATLREERGKVAVCMLFLSGMRADALASLPISCVDLAHGAIYQLPEMGVRTKNRKAAITYLLQIPDLLEVVARWDALLKANSQPLPAENLWYSTLSQDGMTLIASTQAFTGRHGTIADDIRLICQKAGVHYRSPHKLRHGHVVYALKRAKNMMQLKAISQNVMHTSVVVTDQIYGRLVNDDVQEIISSL